MQSVHTFPSRVSLNLRFWPLWIIMTSVGWIVGWCVGLTLGHIMFGTAMIAICISAEVSLLQWPIIPHVSPRSTWWAPAGLVGMAVPLVLYTLIGSHALALDLHWLPVVVVGGTCVGLLQQRDLRQLFPCSWWWALASAMGWALSLLVFIALDTIWPHLDSELGYILLVTVPPGIVMGVITGGALLWHLGQFEQPGTPPRYQPGQSTPAPTWGSARVEQPDSPWPSVWIRWLINPILLIALGPLFLLLSGISSSLAVSQSQTQPPQLDHLPSVAFSPDGTLLAAIAPSTAGGDRLQLWDVATGHAASIQPGTTGTVADLAFSPDGALLVTTNGASVQLWEIATGAMARTFKVTLGPQVLLSPDGSPVRPTDLPPMDVSMPHIAFSPDGALLASSVPEDSVQLWDVASGATLHMLSQPSGVQEFAFSPDGTRLAIASGGALTLWDVATGTRVRELPGIVWPIAVAFSPDGTRVASAERFSGPVLVWDVATGTITRGPKQHWGDVRGLAFSPDGTRLATVAHDNVVRLWDVASGSEVRILRGHASEVGDVTFSADGNLLASAAYDGTLDLWNVTTGKEAPPFTR